MSYALINGGVSKVGFAVASEFASFGYDIIIVDVDNIKLNDVKRDIERIYGVRVIVINISYGSGNHSFEDIFNKICHIEIDILANCFVIFEKSNDIASGCISCLDWSVCFFSDLCCYFANYAKQQSSHCYILNMIPIYCDKNACGFDGSLREYIVNFSEDLLFLYDKYHLSVTCMFYNDCIECLTDRVFSENGFLNYPKMLNTQSMANKAVVYMFKEKKIVTCNFFVKIMLMILRLLPKNISCCIIKNFYKHNH